MVVYSCVLLFLHLLLFSISQNSVNLIKCKERKGIFK